MIDLIFLGLAALLVTGLVVIFVAIITIAIISSILEELADEVDIDRDDVGFLLNEGIQSGKISTITGVFNRRTNEVKNARRVRGNDIESSLTRERVTIFS